MCIYEIVEGRTPQGIYLADKEAKEMSSEKYGQNRAAAAKENALGSEVRGGPYGKGLATDLHTRGGYTIMRQAEIGITIINIVIFK